MKTLEMSVFNDDNDDGGSSEQQQQQRKAATVTAISPPHNHPLAVQEHQANENKRFNMSVVL